MLISKELDRIWTPQCFLCRKNLKNNTYICSNCKNDLLLNKNSCNRCALPLINGKLCGLCMTKAPVFTHCIAPFIYKSPISTIIIQLKFNQKLQYAQLLASLLAENIINFSDTLPECIIPMPLHNKRLRERGFNQALEIAKPLSKQLKIPILDDYCLRTKDTLPQSQLSAAKRAINMKNAFSIKKNIPYRHVAIIDDVMTTGHTLHSLSQTLYRQGVTQIEIWCCARA